MRLVLIVGLSASLSLVPSVDLRAAPGDDLRVPGDARLRPAGTANLIPSNAGLVLSIRNLKDLVKRGDQFLKKHQIQGLGGNAKLRLATIVDLWVLPYLQLGPGLDRSKPILLLVPPPSEDNPRVEIDNAVLTVPATDVTQMTRNFGFPQVPADNEIVEIPDSPRNTPLRYVMLKGRRAYLSLQTRGLESLMKGKPISEQLTLRELERISSADVLLGSSGQTLGEGFGEAVGRLLASDWFSNDEVGKEAGAQLKVMAEAIHFGALAARLQDDGLKFELQTIFEKTQRDEIAKLLTELSGGGQASSLSGLPSPQGAWRPVLAYAARGTGKRNVAFARSLLRLGLASLPGSEEWFDTASRDQLARLFSSVWQQLNGSRAAVYVKFSDQQNQPQGALKATQATAFLVLDLHPEPFLNDLPQLIEQLNTTGNKLAQNTGTAAVTFRYQPDAERIAGVAVGHLTLENLGVEPEQIQPLPRLLGESWNRLRLVPVGKHLIVQAGSENDLLAHLLNNIRTQEGGLADDPAFKDLNQRLGRSRKVEFHVDLSRYVPLAEFGSRRKPGLSPEQINEPAMTSLGLTITPESLQVDFWFPGSEAAIALGIFGYR